MSSQAIRFNRLSTSVVLVLSFVFLLACSVHEQKSGENAKKVDINTPFGGIHVNTDAKAQDTGMDVYPGAQAKEAEDHDKNANVNVQVGDFGVHVIATSYLSNDSPDKVISFYRDGLKKYGTVLECPKGVKETHTSDAPRQIVCNDSGTTENGKLDLAVGVPDHERIVSVKPHGAGTEFSLVYIQTRGGKGDTI